MGANASSLSSSMADEGEGPGLDDIPENCVAVVLSFLEAPEVCRFAGLSRAFRAASLADFVWAPKLPDSYGFLMETLGLAHDMNKMAKRDIFAALCRRNCFDAGTKVTPFSFVFLL